MINIASNLSRTARLFPDKVAIRFGKQQLTYAQLQAAANQLANGLRGLGIGEGDTVALSCPNLPYFPIAYYAVLSLGAVVVPLSILLKAPEIVYHLKDSQARAFLCYEGSADLPMGQEGWLAFSEVDGCEHFFLITADPTQPAAIHGGATLGELMRGQSASLDTVQTNANATAVILYTSGTTGTPKGAELSHANLAMNAQASVALTKLDSRDVQLIALPLFHTFGQTLQMNTSVYCGALMVLLPRFEPEAVLKAMLEYSVTIFCGVPTMYIGILNLPGAAERHDLKTIAGNLRLGISGGAAMPVTVFREFGERFDVAILEGYGLSETSPVATFNHPDGERIPGSIGQAIAGVDVAIVDEFDRQLADGEIGEIVIRGHNVMKGYFNRPEATAEAIRDGWFHTGDIGRRDAKGNFFVVDRLKDMVIRGGFNVYPRELEEVMMGHPAIALVAVIGVAHALHGEEIKAFVVLKPGQVATAEQIIAWCKERMAAYKYPRLLEIVDSLPMTATGKILKRSLKVAAP